MTNAVGLFDPAWLRFHHRICDLYEAIAFRDHSVAPEREIDEVSVVARVLERELKTTPAKAKELTAQLYEGSAYPLYSSDHWICSGFRSLRLRNLPVTRVQGISRYEGFDRFPVRSAVEESLRAKKADIPDENITEIYQKMRGDFLGAEHRHVYFLYYVISHLLASGDYGTTRGDYLMRIVLNQVPEDRSLLELLKRTFRFASFMKSGNQP